MFTEQAEHIRGRLLFTSWGGGGWAILVCGGGHNKKITNGMGSQFHLLFHRGHRYEFHFLLWIHTLASGDCAPDPLFYILNIDCS